MGGGEREGVGGGAGEDGGPISPVAAVLYLPGQMREARGAEL